MYSSLTPGVSLLDSQSSLSFHPQTIDAFSSIGFLGHFDIDHSQSNQDDVVRKIPKFLKRSIAHPSSNPIEFHIQCKQFQITPLWYRSLAGKSPGYICLFHAHPRLFALILYCSIEMKTNSQKFHYEHNSSSMFVFRAKSIEERKRMISCLFTRAKHWANEECQREHGRTNIRWTNQVCFENGWWGTENERSWMNLDTCSTNSSCATSIDSNVDSCTTGTTSQSSVESSSPNPLRSSIAEEEDDDDDDEDDDEYQRSIPPPSEFGLDEESCPIPCSSSSSSTSSLSDGDLKNVSSNAIPTNPPSNGTTTGQFLWIDHYPRRHSIANDTDLLEPNHFHSHPSSPFAERSPSIDDVRARFASAYILTTSSVRLLSFRFLSFEFHRSSFQSLTALNNLQETSFDHEMSINEGSIDLNEGTSSVASWANSFENLLEDETGLHVLTEFLKKEFSQENIQFWTECEKFKKLSDHEQIKSRATHIWKTYLHDTDDGSCRINIDSWTRQECEQALQNQQAHSQIFQLMKYDSYSRFLHSPMYKECLRNEMEGKPFVSSLKRPDQRLKDKCKDDEKRRRNERRFFLKSKVTTESCVSSRSNLCQMETSDCFK